MVIQLVEGSYEQLFWVRRGMSFETTPGRRTDFKLAERLRPVRTCVHDRPGSPLTRYRRAIGERSLLLAELAAREMNHLPRRDALGLLALYAAENDPKYERASGRGWPGCSKVASTAKAIRGEAPRFPRMRRRSLGSVS